MFDTLRAAHGDATLTVLLTGAQPGEEDRLPGASFLAIEQVVGDRWGLIAAGNPPGALPAAVLPHLLAALLGDGGPIIYIGAGVRVCGPLTALLEEVSEHEVALVARSRGDSELALPRGREGAFSRQLIAMRPGASSQRLLDSWPTFFAGEGDDGAGAVRSWLDGIPAVARDVGVVRDGACGADAETLGNSELGERDGSLLIEGSALTAIDLGQLDPGSPLDWPQESVRARLSELPALVGLLEQHAADLLAAGLRTGDAAPGHELAGGLRLTDTIRALLVEGVLAGAITSSPLTTSGREELYAYLNEQDPRGRAAGLSRLHMAIWDSRIELREVYSHLEGPDGSGYAGWLCVHGPTQEGLVPELLPHAPDGAYRQPDYRRPPGRGVNVVGFFTSELGVGEVARLLIAGLDAAQVTALPVRGQLAPPSRQGRRIRTHPRARGSDARIVLLAGRRAELLHVRPRPRVAGNPVHGELSEPRRRRRQRPRTDLPGAARRNRPGRPRRLGAADQHQGRRREGQRQARRLLRHRPVDMPEGRFHRSHRPHVRGHRRAHPADGERSVHRAVPAPLSG